MRLARPILCRRRGTWMLSVGLCLASACAGVSVRTEHAKGHDFRRYRHYAWMAADDAASATAPTASGAAGRLETETRDDPSAIERRVRILLGRKLRSLGYRRSSGARPDFYVRWAGRSERKLKVTPVPHVSGWSHWRGPVQDPTYQSTQVDAYQEAELVIDIIDARSKRRVWRGIATTKLEGDSDMQTMRARIQEAIERMFSRFPP